MRCMFKCENKLCNCQLRKIERYGADQFENANQLLNIPNLLDKLINLIRKPEPKAKTEQVEQAYDKNTVMHVCGCITVKRLDAYGSLNQNIGARFELWEALSNQRKSISQMTALPAGISAKRTTTHLQP